MATSTSIRATYDVLRSLDWTLVTAHYVAVGPSITNPIRILKIKNGTDADLLISFDGLTDRDIAPSNSYDIIDFGGNSSPNAEALEFPGNGYFYVKAANNLPTMGKIYFTVIYVNNV